MARAGYEGDALSALHEERVHECDMTLTDDVTMAVAKGALVLLLLVLIGGTIYLSRTYKERWHKYCTNTFHALDTDKTGTLDEDELYIAVLELHHKLPVRCPPPAKLDVAIMFHQLDQDGSGSIDFDEFDEILTALAIGTTVRCLMIIAAQVFSPVLASLLYSMGKHEPETLTALPAWLQCFGLTIEETLGIRAFLTIVFFVISKQIALPIANVAIRLGTECCVRHNAALKGTRDNDSISPEKIRKRLASQTGAPVQVKAVDPTPLLGWLKQ